jgi:Co/Zn/Cd efflux system component
VTLHAEIGAEDDHHATLLAIKQFLRQRYAIDHATIQLEPGGCADQATGT